MSVPRPLYHFTPPQNFMNDPNGLVFFDGEYHLFYQYNPFSNVHGHMSWGHAVSRDLLHWEHLPVALYEEDDIQIFSGSAVVDWKNTSGFGANSKPPLVAIYTGHSKSEQTQNVAYSTDHGRTWTKYVHNPVIAIGSAQFRDPKILWHTQSRQWIMVIVLADKQKVSFYRSPDLKQWTHLSDFGPAGQVDNEWECPDLFQMNVDGQPDEKKWILKVDVNHSILGQYFIGHFDGIRFISDHPSDHVLRVDYGKDFYAAQSWSDEPKGRRLWIGWMNNWDYANIIPTSSWRGLFSVPRELHLQQSSDGLRLVQQPIKELEQLRQSIFHTTNADVSTINARLSELTMDIAQEILVEFDLDTARELGIKIHTNRLEETVIGYDVQAREMFVDRRNSGNSIFSPVFARLHCAPLRPDHNKITLRVFLDSCSVEVFGNDGQAVISDLIFPDPQNVGMEVYAAGGDVQLKVLEIWKLSDAT